MNSATLRIIGDKVERKDILIRSNRKKGPTAKQKSNKDLQNDLNFDKDSKALEIAVNKNDKLPKSSVAKVFNKTAPTKFT